MNRVLAVNSFGLFMRFIVYFSCLLAVLILSFV